MVALQELNDDVSWILVQYKKTQKERQKVKQKNLATFPPLPNIQKDNEAVANLSKKSTSSSKTSMKLQMNKILNKNTSDNCTTKQVIVKIRNGVKHCNISNKKMMKLFIYDPLILTILITSQSFQL